MYHQPVCISRLAAVRQCTKSRHTQAWVRRYVGMKAIGRLSLNNHDCSGTASQATPQGRPRANATGGKVGFELATYCIHFFVFCQLG